MLETLRHWLGIGSDQTIRYVGLRGTLPPGALVVFIALAAVLTVWLYTRERQISFTRRLVLILLRTAALSILLLILFAPVLGLERQSVVRRNLLVLVDRSQSMDKADKRQESADVLAGALALGKASYEMPAVQESLARSQHTAERIVAALVRSDWDDAQQLQQLLQQAISAANSEAAAATKHLSPQARLRAESFGKPLRELAQREQALREKSTTLSSQAGLTHQQRCQELREPMRQLAAGLGELNRKASPEAAMPAGISGESVSQSRLALAQGLLTHSTFVLGDIARDFNVRYFLFGDTLEEIGTGAAPPPALASATATAPATRAEQITAAIARDTSQPIAGVVVLTDGAFNDDAGPDPLSLASSLRPQGIPLYLVGLGLPAPRDVSVGNESLIVQQAFFPKDRITAQFQVQSRGFAGVATEARLLFNGKEVGKCKVELANEPRYGEITFVVPDGLSGEGTLELVLPEQPGEDTTVNNRAKKRVDIVTGPINVLYVEGNPRWEFRYLKKVLQRDPRLHVRFLMTRGDKELPASSKEYLASFPTQVKDSFGYDLVILGDVPSWYFSKEQLASLEGLVRNNSGALLMLAGDRYAPTSYIDTPLADMLPVKINSDFVPIHPLEYPVPTLKGKDSFTQLENSDEANDAVWSLVRPLYRLPRLGPKEAATVLAELPVSKHREESYPLIAWQQVGSGKVMYVGLDQLWRLRYKLGDHYHARFWSQAIQFLALSRLLGEKQRIYLHADKKELQPGQRAEITARVLDASFQPVKASEFVVRLKRSADQPAAASPDSSAANPSGKTLDTTELKLEPVRGTPGLFHGVVALKDEGKYKVEPATADAKSANALAIYVADAHREQQQPALQEETLRKMADLSGGKYLTIADWPTLGGLLEGEQHTLVEVKEFDLWDSWILYAMFVVCVGSEWLIRRRSYLM